MKLTTPHLATSNRLQERATENKVHRSKTWTSIGGFVPLAAGVACAGLVSLLVGASSPALELPNTTLESSATNDRRAIREYWFSQVDLPIYVKYDLSGEVDTFAFSTAWSLDKQDHIAQRMQRWRMDNDWRPVRLEFYMPSTNTESSLSEEGLLSGSPGMGLVRVIYLEDTSI